MGASQPRQRPRKRIQEAIGTLSRVRSRMPQAGQRDPGRTIDSPLGSRWATTLRNDPTAAPRRPMAMSGAIIGGGRSAARPWSARRGLLGLAQHPPGRLHGIEELRRRAEPQLLVVDVVLRIAGADPAAASAPHRAAVL